jgi:hypothetical protein
VKSFYKALVLRACVCERVIGLVRGKVAGSIFLSFTYGEGGEVIMGYQRYP